MANISKVNNILPINISKVNGVSKSLIKRVNSYDLKALGKEWAVVPSIPSGLWNGVAYGNGVFVATNLSNNTIMTSTNGLTWVTSTLPTSTIPVDIIFANGIFTIICFGGTPTNQRILTSTNGTTWTPVTAPIAEYNSIVYGNGMYVANSNTSTVKIIYSTNGTTWNVTNPASITANNSAKLGFANGNFLLSPTSSSTTVLMSTDAINWTASATISGGGSRAITAWATNGGITVGSGLGTNTLINSPNLTNWVPANPVTNVYWISTIYASNIFVAVAFINSATTPTIIYSEDGINWTSTTSIANSLRDVTFGGDRFIAVGYDTVLISQ